MSLLRYISHAEVVIDPAVPVPQWSLSERGRSRVKAMAAQPWMGSVTRIITSAETKAVETAGLLAGPLGLEPEVRAATGETDRSATGFVIPARHDELSDRFFAQPEVSAEGWERAIDAQSRVANALVDLLTESNGDDGNTNGDVAVVGHGGVGTLLYCQLAGLPIGQGHDQPHQGHYWTLDRATGRLQHGWRPIDVIEAA